MDTLDPLICDLLGWLAPAQRSYGEVMEAWRTSCPRLPVWEEVNERGLVAHTRVEGRPMLQITPAGRAFLAERGRLHA